MKKIISVDFDGTLSSYRSGWLGAHIASDPPTPGAMDFLREALAHFSVHIHSARSESEKGRKVMKDWLLQHYKSHHRLTTAQAVKELSAVQWPLCKPHAHLSLDDRAVQFKGVWPSMQEIRDFKPWNR